MKDEKSEFEKENRKLKAELTILRANLRKLEKENDTLKVEKSKFIVNKLEIEQAFKKKLELHQKETKIEENRRKIFKEDKQDKGDISSRFILHNTIDLARFGLDSSFQCEGFLKNLRFFRDFFFDDFYSISDEKALEIVAFFNNKNQKEFLEAFSLFSCKRTVFLKFLDCVYTDNSFIKLKTDILIEAQPDWIIEAYENHLSRFITTNKTLLVELYANIAEKCPFHLKRALDKETFNFFLSDLNPMNYKLIYFVVKNRIKDYIDETNIHLVPKEMVCQYFSLRNSDCVCIYR